MVKLRELFRIGNASDDIDWDALKVRALYPDLIGRKSEDIVPALGSKLDILCWMKCDCGMMVMTTPDLHDQRTTCAHCRRHAHDAVDGIGVFTEQRTTTIRPQTERRLLFALVVFCVVAASVFGNRMLDAPPRVQADAAQLD